MTDPAYDTTLKIRSTGSGLVLLVVGIVFLGVGIFSTLSMATTITLGCTRVETAQFDCQIERSLLFFSLDREPIGDLQGARVDRSRSRDNSTYRVVLLTGQGETYLTSYSSSGYSQKQQIADQINAFVADSARPAFSVSQSPGAEILLVLVFAAAGVLMLAIGFQTCLSSWTFNRLSGLLIHEKATLLHGIQKIEYPLHKIQDVQVESNRGRRGSHTYRVVMWMASGEALPLTSFYSSGWDGKQKTVARIRQFLGLGNDDDMKGH